MWSAGELRVGEVWDLVLSFVICLAISLFFYILLFFPSDKFVALFLTSPEVLIH